MKVARRKAVVLLASAGVALSIALGVVLYVRLVTEDYLPDWSVSIDTQHSAVEFVAAVFRRGGFAFANHGLVLLKVDSEACLYCGIRGIPAFGEPLETHIDLTALKPILTEDTNQLMALLRECAAAQGSADGVDDYEYFVYMKEGPFVTKYHTDDILLMDAGIKQRFDDAMAYLFIAP